METGLAAIASESERFTKGEGDRVEIFAYQYQESADGGKREWSIKDFDKAFEGVDERLQSYASELWDEFAILLH